MSGVRGANGPVMAGLMVLLAGSGISSPSAPGAPLPLPGARVLRVCAAAGPFWPTMTLALRGTSAWVACKEQSRVTRVDTRRGKTVRSPRLGGPAIAVASGFASIWALDSSGTLYRLSASSAKILKRIALPTSAAYNVWIGGGSVWVADDQGAQVVRVSPRTNRVVARVPVGDGPADIAFNGGTAWVVNHRDRVLSAIDLGTNRSRRVSVLAGDAPERMVWSRGSLWITGRGTDLLKVDPADGSLERTIEIGASGIDVVADGDELWVPTRSAAVDASGFPRMDALKRISASSGAVATVVRATGRVDVHGLAARQGTVWIADNTNGRLYRVP
jgi:DNA-binding beta-propeller fold protein YncE